MANKKGILPPRKDDEPMGFRAVSFRDLAAADDDKRMIPVTLATGAGVDVYDRTRGLIKEYRDMPVAVGADRNSMFGSVPALRAYFDATGLQEEQMNEQYRAHLVSLGMSADLDDAAALDWATRNVQEKPEAAPVVPAKVAPPDALKG